MNARSIFEKHLKGITPTNGYLAKNIKDLNQAIGSLQTLDSTLKKFIQHIQSPDEFPTLAASCVFMGENLIHKEIILLLFEESRSFFLQDPTLLEAKSPQELQAYFTQKREEIAEILDWVMEKMESSPTESSFSPAFSPLKLSEVQ